MHEIPPGFLSLIKSSLEMLVEWQQPCQSQGAGEKAIEAGEKDLGVEGQTLQPWEGTGICSRLSPIVKGKGQPLQKHHFQDPETLRPVYN